MVDLLVRYLENRCTPQELQQVEKVLAGGRHEEEWKAALDLTAMDVHSDNQEPLSEEKSSSLFSKINETIDHRSPRVVSMAKRNMQRIAAASVIIIAAAGWLLLRQGNKPATETLAAISTEAKQQKNLILPDGTKIWLNSNSKLSYRSSYASKNREVYLEGEAFFDVAPNAELPFSIHSSDLTVQVLGTSFNVRSYQNDSEIDVAVATGKVAVMASGQQQVISPGNLISWHKQNGGFEKRTIAINDINAWSTGWMVFDEETLESVCHALERAYGVNIHFENPALRNKKITLKQRHEQLNNVLTVMSITSGIQYRRQGNEIWIR
ncbi:DUF4974 domain-containing protein [Pseudoflavitalea sp. G-6-1-2]|uniref:FecR family protein n=1 Tax=Pseudoflavitalea sp. G-6-1-2 TaxID=2728841 RepID=UPI00146F7BA4|nr:FecR domain-containing protein [Pseudoflavitalea sp. G-6-1-2]NML21980.1 DUF4974 domain-containing protein [Pseudoflavitalea sp. G-6-1-2]